MSHRSKTIILISIVVILLAGGGYIGAQWANRNPLKVRVLGYKRVSEKNFSVQYEVENASAFPVMAIIYAGLYEPDPSGFVDYHHLFHDLWDGKVLKPGEKQSFDLPAGVLVTPTDSEVYFVYGWDPMPRHMLRKLVPGFRRYPSLSSLPVRVGTDGPFVLEDIEKSQP
jgi:hypothetical protein